MADTPHNILINPYAMRPTQPARLRDIALLLVGGLIVGAIMGVIALAVLVGILATALIASAQQQTVQANQNADNAQNTVVAANASLTGSPRRRAAGSTRGC